MPVTEKTPLGATTTNRKWYLDIDTGTAGSPLWAGVFGITSFTPTVNGNLQDDSDFDSAGWGSQTNTQNAWENAGTVRRGVTAADATVYDPGQEFLRAAASKTGVGNSVHVRWYEMEPNGPRVEAYEGDAATSWTEDGGDTTALSTASFVLAGQGARIETAHPDGVV